MLRDTVGRRVPACLGRTQFAAFDRRPSSSAVDTMSGRVKGTPARQMTDICPRRRRRRAGSDRDDAIDASEGGREGGMRAGDKRPRSRFGGESAIGEAGRDRDRWAARELPVKKL